MLVRFASYILPLLLLAACSSQPSKVDEQPEQLADDTAPESSESQADADESAQDESASEDGVPADLTNLYKRGLTLMKSERYSQAKNLWVAASERFADYPGVWVNLGLAQYHAESYDEAKESLDQALALNSSFCPAYKTLGLVARELGDFKLSEQSYISAVECAPEDGNVRRNLGILYDLYLHDERRALEQYEAAKKLYFAKDKNLEIWIADLKSRLPAPVVETVPAAAESAEQPINNEENSEGQQPLEASEDTSTALEQSEAQSDQTAAPESPDVKEGAEE